MTVRKKRKRGHTPLQLDGYRALPGTVEPPPESWRQAFATVNGHIMRTLTNVFGFVADVSAFPRELLRLVPQLFSRKIAVTVGQAHFEADSLEAKKQEESQHEASTRPDVDAVAENLGNLLSQLQAEGLHVNVTSEDGRLVVVVVRPDLAEAAHDIAKQAVSKPAEQQVEKGAS
jgi:hypothetical protein